MRPRFVELLHDLPVLVGWPTILEVRIWSLRRAGALRQPWLEDWLESPTTTTVPFDGELERLAASAYQRFGKGRHAAGLNFGDCMAYAVARHRDVPLLFKGGDFARTDVAVHEASLASG